MAKARVPDSQAERLAALRSFDVLDTPREADFDEIVELASRICETPISVINLIDEHRQWFKAEVGLGVRETPLDTSICAHAILEPGLTIINDTLNDPRMADNPLCLAKPGLRFYAGALLKSEDGYPLGTLCVLDNEPRDLNETQRFALEVLSRQVISQLRLRKMAAEESRARELADEKAGALREAAEAQDILLREIDHRVKNSLSMVAALLNVQIAGAQSDEAVTHLTVARNRVLAIAALHEQLHVAAKHDRVDMTAFLDRLGSHMMQNAPARIALRFKADPITLDTRSASAVGVLINELVTNAIKHAFPKGNGGAIEVDFNTVEDGFHLQVADTGIGFSNGGAFAGAQGLGMRIIQASVGQLGGKVEHIDNAPGSRFSIRLPFDAGASA